MIKRKEVVRSLVTFQDGDCDGDDGTTYSSYSGSDSGSTRPSSRNGEEGDRPPLMSMMTLARVRCGLAPWDILKGHHHLATPKLDRWEAEHQAFPAAVPALGYDSKWILYLKTSAFNTGKDYCSFG